MAARVVSAGLASKTHAHEKPNPMLVQVMAAVKNPSWPFTLLIGLVAKEGASIAESTLSEFLAGKRKLNRGQIARLARYFKLDPGVFLV